MPTVLDALGLEIPRQCDGDSPVGFPYRGTAARVAAGGPLGA